MQTSSSTSRWLLVAAVAGIVLVSAGHYLTHSHDVALHNAYRRLYYVPVVLAAFGGGLRGGLAAAIACVIAYLPHAFLMEHHHRDPAPGIDKAFEMILYVVVGGLSGWLVERERISRRKLMHSLEERNELEHQLVRAGRLSALGELVAGVAHEVRNPLAAIMGAAEALERSLDKRGDDKLGRLVDVQLREVARLDRVVSNFLAFARTQDPARTAFELEPLLIEIVELAQHHGEEGTFVCDESVEEVVVHADRDQIEQVLLNLTLNAMQAASPETFHIIYLYRWRMVAKRTHHCIGVRDHGPGIAPELREQIFDPYVTTRACGSGLGLSISSRVAEAHGGYLDVEVDDDTTTFWLCLPRTRDDEETR